MSQHKSAPHHPRLEYLPSDEPPQSHHRRHDHPALPSDSNRADEEITRGVCSPSTATLNLSGSDECDEGGLVDSFSFNRHHDNGSEKHRTRSQRNLHVHFVAATPTTKSSLLDAGGGFGSYQHELAQPRGRLGSPRVDFTPSRTGLLDKLRGLPEDSPITLDDSRLAQRRPSLDSVSDASNSSPLRRVRSCEDIIREIGGKEKFIQEMRDLYSS